MKHFKFILATLIICSVSISFSQEKMTPELLWKLKRVGGVQVSPDLSKTIYSTTAYQVKEETSSREIKLIDLKTNVITNLSDKLERLSFLSWYSNEHLLVQKTTAENKEVGLFNISDFSYKKMAIFPKTANGIKLSSDKQHFLFIQDVKLDQKITERHPDLPKANAIVTEELMFRHWDQWHDYKYSHVFVMSKVDGNFTNAIDIMPNERFDSPLNPFGGMEQISFSADSKSIVYTSKKKTGLEYAESTNSQLYRYDIQSKKQSCITTNYKGYDVQPVFSNTGDLAWLSMEKNGFESDKNDIILRDAKTKTDVNLTEAIDLTVSDFIFNLKGDKIYFKAVTEATYQLFELDIKTKKHRQITTGQHNYSSLHFAGKKLIGTRQDMNHPNEVFSIDIKKGKQEQLTDENKEVFSKLKTCPIQKRWITTSDDKKMLTWVILPPDFDSTKTYPTLLYCQGGPQSAVSQFYSFRWNFQLMASNGYIVVAPNRRGLPGFGQEWNDAISKDWGGQPMDDYLSAIDEISKESYVDEDKIGAVGASYGGYSVYYLAGIHENRFKTFISHCGLFNLESWYGTTEELFFANWDIGGPYWKKENKELYLKNSPHKMIDKWNTPMMVIHGGNDFRVPISEGLQAYQAAQIKGIPSKFLYFPEEGHWVLSPQNGLVWHREFFGWLDQWLKK